MSFAACLKPPKIGGNILIVSIATLQVYFILVRSSQVKGSPLCLLLAISSCSATQFHKAIFKHKFHALSQNMFQFSDMHLEEQLYKQKDH